MVDFRLTKQVISDTTPPALNLLSNITEATGPSGATVAFNVSATDLVSSGVAPTCAPASGSTFTLGITTVNCSATDQAGNAAGGGFIVTVVDTTRPTVTDSFFMARDS